MFACHETAYRTNTTLKRKGWWKGFERVITHISQFGACIDCKRRTRHHDEAEGGRIDRKRPLWSIGVIWCFSVATTLYEDIRIYKAESPISTSPEVELLLESTIAAKHLTLQLVSRSHMCEVKP